MRQTLKNKIHDLPQMSGVYLMKDAKGQIIYIGKAKRLKSRVTSYFRGKVENIKTKLLVENIVDLDIIPTASEAGALILEASLVKKYLPKYNIELKDGKSYPYIQVTKESFPLVSVVRLTKPDQKKKGYRYFGPYVDATLVREALSLLRKIFPFRSCDPLPKKACLYSDIGSCLAPCVKKVTQKDYRKNIQKIMRILSGDSDALYRDLRQEMEALSEDKKFEEAASVRDQIRAVGALYSSSPDLNCFKEAEQLERALNLDVRPERIECIDISTIFGEHSVGSLVSFLSGKPDKSNYRRFKIKEVQGMDDFKMVAEVVRRRYGRLKKEGKAYPDLIMIDGGKGQLSAAAKELKEVGLVIPIISLAKKEEEVFVPGKRAAIILSKDSLGLKLLQRVRDEAHRFAITYHRKLRSQNIR